MTASRLSERDLVVNGAKAICWEQNFYLAYILEITGGCCAKALWQSQAIRGVAGEGEASDLALRAAFSHPGW